MKDTINTDGRGRVWKKSDPRFNLTRLPYTVQCETDETDRNLSEKHKIVLAFKLATCYNN